MQNDRQINNMNEFNDLFKRLKNGSEYLAELVSMIFRIGQGEKSEKASPTDKKRKCSWK
jgi:hypothetical protein